MADEHITPPLKLGHSERQYLLKSEGLPSAGRVTNCWFDAKTSKLMVTGENVPSVLRDAIDKKAYFKCSAEIYDDPPEEIKKAIKDAGGKGKVLRALALLGEDLPRVKTLSDLPGMYKETGAFKRPIEAFQAGVKNDDGECYTKQDLEDISANFHILKAAGIDPSKFSDSSTFHFVRLFYEPTQGDDSMDAAALRKMLEESGISPDVLKAIPDDQLAMLVDKCKSMTSDNGDDEDSEEEKKKKADEEEAAKKKAAENAEGGKTMTYAEVKKLLADNAAETTKAMLAKFSEIAGDSNKKVKDAADESIKVIEKGQKQIKLSAFSESLDKVKSAGLPPALDNGGAIAFIAEELLASKTVKKFGEKDASAFDAFNSLIQQIPAHMPKKGEKGAVLDNGKRSDFEEHEKEEVEKVKATYSKYEDTWSKQGTTEADLVKAFKVQLKSNKNLTASEFLKVE